MLQMPVEALREAPGRPAAYAMSRMPPENLAALVMRGSGMP